MKPEVLKQKLKRVRKGLHMAPNGFCIEDTQQGEWVVKEQTTGQFYRVVSRWETFDQAVDDLVGRLL